MVTIAVLFSVGVTSYGYCSDNDKSTRFCFHSENPGTVSVCYPGRVFANDADGDTSKKYVQRFLYATKSDMLFASKVIMVEGLAEELLQLYRSIIRG